MARSLLATTAKGADCCTSRSLWAIHSRRVVGGVFHGKRWRICSKSISVFVIAVVVVVIIFIFSGVKQVPQASEFTLERFGRYTRTMSPGLHLIVPFIDRVGHRLSIQESVLDIPAQDVITVDNASVTCDAVCFFQIVDAARAAYEVRDLPRAMTNITMTNIRSVIGSMPLDDVGGQSHEG